MNFDLNKMTIQELRGVLQVLVENLNHEHNRITALQDRVLKLEIEIME